EDIANSDRESTADKDRNHPAREKGTSDVQNGITTSSKDNEHGSDNGLPLKNSKHEIRNSKQIQMTKPRQTSKQASPGLCVLDFPHLRFICPNVCFGFRYSDFGFFFLGAVAPLRTINPFFRCDVMHAVWTNRPRRTSERRRRSTDQRGFACQWFSRGPSRVGPSANRSRSPVRPSDTIPASSHTPPETPRAERAR